MSDESFGADPEVVAAKTAYGAAVHQLAPSLAKQAQRSLERVCTPNWTLEWLLPRWLGESLALSDNQVGTLTLSNVFGLVTVRLLDDLVDEEVEAPDLPSPRPCVLLPTALYHLWIRQYRPLLDGCPAFWDHLDHVLKQWLEATYAATRPPSKPFDSYGETDLLALAQRGAPLKLCAVGACLLAGRESLIAPLTACLDHLLAAAVLLDNLKDWSADLAAGRHNLFVAYSTPLPQTETNREKNRSAVLREVGAGGGARRYFDIMLDQLALAEKQALPLGSAQLNEYIRAYREQIGELRQRIGREVRERLVELAAELLGLASPGDLLATAD